MADRTLTPNDGDRRTMDQSTISQPPPFFPPWPASCGRGAAGAGGLRAHRGHRPVRSPRPQPRPAVAEPTVHRDLAAIRAERHAAHAHPLQRHQLLRAPRRPGRVRLRAVPALRPQPGPVAGGGDSRGRRGPGEPREQRPRRRGLRGAHPHRRPGRLRDRHPSGGLDREGGGAAAGQRAVRFAPAVCAASPSPCPPTTPTWTS